jgi:hypothetical protein
MTVEMHLEGTFIDASPLVNAFLSRHKHYLPGVIKALLLRHGPLLKGAKELPVFYLCGIASSINGFTPLTHPPQP